MKYPMHYERLIQRARTRILEGYRERHHVIPRCLGGGNDARNIVELTPEEHYVAHQLLCKMHPLHVGLATAAVWMAKKCTGNKAYGWLQRKRSELMRGNQRCIGRKMSPETRKKIGAANRGHTYLVGIPKSAEHRRNLAVAHVGKPLSAEHRAKIGVAGQGRRPMLGKRQSAESRVRISASLKAYHAAKRVA